MSKVREALNQANILAIQGPQKTGKSTLVRALLGSRNEFAVSSTRNTEVIGVYLLGKSNPLHVADFPGSDHNTKNIIFETAEELRQTCESFIKMTIIVLNYRRIGQEEVNIVMKNLELKVPFLICLNNADQLFGATLDEACGRREELESKSPSSEEIRKWLRIFSREVDECHNRIIDHHLHGVHVNNNHSVWFTSLDPRGHELRRQGFQFKMSQLYEANKRVKGIEHVRLWIANEMLKVGQNPKSIHNLFEGHLLMRQLPSADAKVFNDIERVEVRDFKELIDGIIQKQYNSETKVMADIFRERFQNLSFENQGSVFEVASMALFGHSFCQGTN